MRYWLSTLPGSEVRLQEIAEAELNPKVSLYSVFWACGAPKQFACSVAVQPGSALALDVAAAAHTPGDTSSRATTAEAANPYQSLVSFCSRRSLSSPRASSTSDKPPHGAIAAAPASLTHPPIVSLASDLRTLDRGF